VDFSAASMQKKCDFSKDGSFVLVVLAELKEFESGLAVLHGSRIQLLSEIVDSVSGEKCLHLMGKPKIFLFLDQCAKSDAPAVFHNKVMYLKKASWPLFRLQ